jgi:hypothetical protein
MKKVLILVEGQSEETFVKRVLSPHLLTDSPSTSPSARLRAIYPQYGKIFYGTRIASSIGLDTMRAECRHFNEWLTRLEMLSDAADHPDPS